MRNINDSVAQINEWIVLETKKKEAAEREIAHLLAVLAAKAAR